MKINIICFTKKGCDLGRSIEKSLLKENLTVDLASGSSYDYGIKKVSLKEWTKKSFEDADAIVFISAIGIAVRTIAPYVQTKVKDPAVIVIDDTGKYVIPILSGHVGGANALATRISNMLGATAVITTATDNNNVFAIDTWAKNNNISIINPQNIKYISSKLLNGESIKLKTEFSVEGLLPEGIKLTEDEGCDLYIGYKSEEYLEGLYGKEALFLIPKALVIGVGARKNLEYKFLEDLFLEVLEENKISKCAIYKTASIDIKLKEPAINRLSMENKLEFITFTSEELNDVEGEFSASGFVKSITGTDNVCERSAVKASQGKLLIKKRSKDGATIAIAVDNYRLNFEKNK